MVDHHPDIERELRRKGHERAEKERRESHDSHLHFSREPYSATRANELRERHRRGPVSPEESLELLVLGNMEHAAEVKEKGDSPLMRHQRIVNNQADYLEIKCSDARIPSNSNVGDKLVGLEVRIAGNVVPGRKTASAEEIREALGHVRKDGIVLVAGHGPKCGAVEAKVKWVEDEMPETGAKELDELLHEVVGTSPKENAIAQLSKLRQTMDVGGRSTGAVIYDFEHGGTSIVSETATPLMELYIDNFNRRHGEAMAREPEMRERLKVHRPHVIAIGTVDLPYNVSAIFNARQNEVFSTTGSEKGLDNLDKASILYAIEHLEVRHIALIAPGLKGEQKSLDRMFNRWERELREMDVHHVPLIAKMLDSGQLKISRLRYDLEKGMVVEVPALPAAA
ncbi:MAG: carbonic anhydrase [Candidatus Micrarchaeota archaeon]